MNDPVCTSEEAIRALGYLRNAFGGYGIPEVEERPYLRMFTKFTPALVRDAIDRLVITSKRRPSPNDIAQVIQLLRAEERRANPPALAKVEPCELTPPESVHDRVQALRELMGAGA